MKITMMVIEDWIYERKIGWIFNEFFCPCLVGANQNLLSPPSSLFSTKGQFFFSSGSPFFFWLIMCLLKIKSMARSCIYFAVGRACKVRQGSTLLLCLQGISELRFDLTCCCLAL